MSNKDVIPFCCNKILQLRQVIPFPQSDGNGNDFYWQCKVCGTIIKTSGVIE